MSDYKQELINVVENQINQANIEFKKGLSKYKDSKDKIINYLTTLYIDYAVKGVLDINTVPKKKLNKFKKLIQEELKNNSTYESSLLTSILIKVYKDCYSSFSEKLETILNKTLVTTKLTDSFINNEVNNNWSGIPFSERIFSNQQSLANSLWSSIILSMRNSQTIDEVGKIVNKTFNSKAYESLRLEETETMRLISQVTDKIYSENKIKKVLWETSLESNVCSECASLHGEIFDLDDTSRPIPPRHARCHCFYLPVI